MRYIEQFREGMRVSDVYLCKTKQHAVTKNGKEYASVLLQDKTGTVDCKIWDLSSPGINDFEPLQYVYVDGDVTVFQGSNQLNIKRIRKADEGEYQESDYLPVSSKDIKIMYQELTALVQSFQNPYLKKLASSYFLEDKAFVKKFCFHSAAKSVHHGFVGGLLEHTLSVMKLCDFYTKSYPALNRDLLLTAALFHDIGKVQELSAFPENDYTDDGQLLGHIVIGTMMVADRIKEIPGFPAKTAAELKHCILAHHGELEYGSPKKPALLEALALNFAKNKYKVVYFSLETRPDKLVNRMATNWCGLDFDDVKRRTLDMKTVDLNLMDELAALPIEIVPASGKSVAWMRSEALRRKADVAMVDYLGLVKSDGKTRYEKVTNASLAMHDWAQSTNMLVIALSQLNRGGAGQMPSMEDLRESGQIEQDADEILLLHKDDDKREYTVKAFVYRQSEPAGQQQFYESGEPA